MSTVKEKSTTPIHNDNLKNAKPFTAKKGSETTPKAPVLDPKADVSNNAKNLKAEEIKKPEESTLKPSDAEQKAASVVSDLAKLPVLPIAVPTAKPDSKIMKKLEDKMMERVHYIKKPAVIFIEGFSAFGISNGDGIRDMAENYPDAKKFDWDEKDKIVDEIKKHALDQPVVLVGHSFGGDTAVEVADELNSAKNGFRSVDLLISLDSVGFKNNIMPINVKRNLNFFEEGIVPFLHGNPNIARNTDHTEVINELRSELHSKIDDSPEVQFKVFESINETLGNSNEPEIVIQLDLKDLIGSQLFSEKK